ncbi:hypothetical protein LEP1GSC175_3805 [Leptospira santarosai str. HAI821]|nr:hypothetical protein LEP1GSC163_2362 [Leptospira santarosai str. CBC379]EMO31693.1 hypothetical protein LEP1GSC175_3805 [Leptospira santarosai str. HAI821]
MFFSNGIVFHSFLRFPSRICSDFTTSQFPDQSQHLYFRKKNSFGILPKDRFLFSKPRETIRLFQKILAQP